MMLYLTGAQNSLKKTEDNPQTDPQKSLGGYISSTMVPNSAVNALFDLISSYSIEKKSKETIALGLINKFEVGVRNVRIKIVTDEMNECSFKVAAVNVGENYAMESISSRYQEPISAEFYDASFYRAFVNIKILNPLSEGEELALIPFGVIVNGIGGGIDGTWEAFQSAFEKNDTYSVRRIDRNTFKIERRDEEVIDPGLNCSYVATEAFTSEFEGKFENKISNSLLLKETFDPNEAIGIWLQRKVKGTKISNQKILEDYKSGYVKEDLEKVEVIIDYEIADEP